MQFGFWDRRRRGARTYLSRTRDPQSFANCVAGSGHDLEECFAGAKCRELVRRDGSRAVAVNETRLGKRHGRAAEKDAPTLLIFSGTLSERQSNGGVLGDLLWQAGVHSSEVGQALGRKDAHHAGLTRAGEQRDHVPALASESGELVDDDQAGSGALGGDTHQVEQDPRTDLRGKGGVRCDVETEEYGLSVLDALLQRQSGSEVLAGDPFDDQSEARPEPGHTLALELAETVNVTAQSSGLRCVNVAQQGQELVGFEEVQYALGCPRQACEVDRLNEPQHVALRGSPIDVGVARIPFALDQAVGHAGRVTPQWVPAQRSANAPDNMVGRGGDSVLQAGGCFAVQNDDGKPTGKGIDEKLEGAGLAAARRTAQ